MIPSSGDQSHDYRDYIQPQLSNIFVLQCLQERDLV